MTTYTVNLHHRGGFIKRHQIDAVNRKAAEVAVRAMYPASVISKIVVL